MSSDLGLKVFTFDVALTVNVFAINEDEARAKLDAEGGFASSRDVVLRAVTEVIKPIRELKSVPKKPKQ